MRLSTQGGGEVNTTRGAYFSWSLEVLLSVNLPVHEKQHAVWPPSLSQSKFSRGLFQERLWSHFAGGSGKIFVYSEQKRCR